MIKLRRLSTSRALGLVLGLWVSCLVGLGGAYGDKPEIFANRAGLAINGYDTVAYFEDDHPVKGSAEFETSYLGATWRFASAEHLDLFLADPDAYVPQYGGYCAWAMGHGDVVKSDPEVWTLYQDKLYLNINKRYQKKWLADIDMWIAKADAFWPDVLSQ